MSEWAIYTWDDINLEWDDDGTISRPNSDMSEIFESTQKRIMLADGSDAYVVPETKYAIMQIPMRWLYKSSTFKNKIVNYVKDYDYLKIVTHLAGVQWIGRFISVQTSWLVGQEPDIWEVNSVFEVMEEE